MPTITAFLPTTNLKLSKQFYSKKIGLDLVSEDDYALEFEGHGTSLRITLVNEFKPHPFTVLGFKVLDIVADVKLLSKKGVTFEKYNSMDQDDLGIWNSSSGAKIAWFKDPDANLISLTQYSV